MSVKAVNGVLEHFHGWSYDTVAFEVMLVIAYRVRLVEDAQGDPKELEKLRKYQDDHNIEDRQVVITREEFIRWLGGSEFLQIIERPEQYTPEEVTNAKRRVKQLGDKVGDALRRIEERTGLKLRGRILTSKGNYITAKRGNATVFYCPTAQELKDAAIIKARYDKEHPRKSRPDTYSERKRRKHGYTPPEGSVHPSRGDNCTPPEGSHTQKQKLI